MRRYFRAKISRSEKLKHIVLALCTDAPSPKKIGERRLWVADVNRVLDSPECRGKLLIG